jgi:hypothetical protein
MLLEKRRPHSANALPYSIKRALYRTLYLGMSGDVLTFLPCPDFSLTSGRWTYPHLRFKIARYFF